MENLALHFISFYHQNGTIVDIELVIFVGILFLTFADTLSVEFIISLHTFTIVSAILIKYSPF